MPEAHLNVEAQVGARLDEAVLGEVQHLLDIVVLPRPHRVRSPQVPFKLHHIIRIWLHKKQLRLETAFCTLQGNFCIQGSMSQGWTRQTQVT
jgi:hypothetical protein